MIVTGRARAINAWLLLGAAPCCSSCCRAAFAARLQLPLTRAREQCVVAARCGTTCSLALAYTQRLPAYAVAAVVCGPLSKIRPTRIGLRAQAHKLQLSALACCKALASSSATKSSLPKRPAATSTGRCDTCTSGLHCRDSIFQQCLLHSSLALHQPQQ